MTPGNACLGRRTFLCAALTSSLAAAFGRTELGGTLRLALPLAGGGLDPHAGDDPLAALFGAAVAEPLFALGPDGRPYPTLAQALPRATERGARVALRPGMKSGRGKPLDARDLLFSLGRAAKHGGAAVLGELGAAVPDRDPLALIVPGADPDAVARALASPATALVPRGFSALAPDGAGPFRATVSGRSLLLETNPEAARGAAFLARVEVSLVADMAEALRAFEADRADVGWLGGGLHRPRQGSVAFEGPSLGWVILRTGRDARGWGAPGIAQQLLDRVPREPFRQFGVGPAPGAAATGASWGGGAAELLVNDESAQFVRIAETLAPLLSAPGQAVTPVRLPPAELEKRRASGRFLLMLDFVRAAGPAGKPTLLALLAAAAPELAARPPRVTSYAPLDVARTLPLGVLGTLRVAGARLPDWKGIESWDLGNVSRARRTA